MPISVLSLLRSSLKERQIDAFIVGSGDAHQSEYVSNSELRRQFISGFSGSAGTALVLQDHAYLWTDGRYFLQASVQLGSEWTLMKSGQPGVLELNDWVVANMKQGQTVGVDSSLISTNQAKQLKSLFETKGITLVSVDNNPIDEIWCERDRPAPPSSPIIALNITITGVSHEEKIKNVQSFIAANNATALVVSMLDDVAWLLNIRGEDVECCPVAISYAVVTLNQTFLFIDKCKVTDAIVSHLGSIVTILPYEDISQFLHQQAQVGKVICDLNQLNWRLYLSVGETAALDKVSPIALSKSLKNAIELEGFRKSHIRDGVALTAFFHWLEQQVVATPGCITEYEVTEKLEEYRSKMQDHKGPSFPTIAAYGPNGAMMHYKPERDTAATVGIDSTFLMDSGAQYLDGTTDVTRTKHYGVPSDKIKQCYTAVLKGHIALASLIIPEGTLGSRIDSIARLALWQQGLDYNHGTGHGVGVYLNVHEGPQGIGFRSRVGEVGFYAGMTISNEPGYYEDGHFGIRIENLCITVPVETPYNFMNKKYVGFETVTLSPIATNLIDISMLTTAEITWLNEYHHKVRTILSPLMQEHFPEAVGYLIEKTEPI